jgi:hypothetical protein
VLNESIPVKHSRYEFCSLCIDAVGIPRIWSTPEHMVVSALRAFAAIRSVPLGNSTAEQVIFMKAAWPEIDVTDEKPKMCPFCGGTELTVGRTFFQYYIVCQKCEACGPNSRYKHGAAQLWNRADPRAALLNILDEGL